MFLYISRNMAILFFSADTEGFPKPYLVDENLGNKARKTKI